ncbi:oxidoreductase [Thalassospira mesophila]|uniref:Probable oxidoreductase n=1 Tax=Thalassospira mesophila TaxID=1293891 RepID=A0A1Y2L240_9PROT|nr:oxidoreductase [Thalassospira mesophila]OSQ39549.1 oxidoreductase [Thalassospira mesophila]
MTTAQAPIGSGFSASSTADDVIKGQDLTGKVAIVTGGYSGLGLETVRVFVGAGAHVIVPTRDRAKAEKALADLPDVELMDLDLMDPASIDAFADAFLASKRPLHVLVNNAAVMASPLMRDERGNEAQFSTNHLGHFQLTMRLWPALCQANGARVIAVSSRGHRYSPVDFEDPNFNHREYDPWKSYGQAKTANALFARALDKRGQPHNVRAFSLHPGGILATNLSRHMSDEALKATGFVAEDGSAIIDPQTGKKTLEQGAATTVWCATSPQLNGMGGVYCEDCDISPVVSADAKTIGVFFPGVWPWAVDPAQAEQLWDLTEKMTGVSFPG